MYYVVFLLGIISSQLKDNKNRFFIFFTVVIAFLAFFRYGVGPDYFSYQYLYVRLNDSIIDEVKYGIDNQEILFKLMGSFLKKIGFSYQQYLIIFSIINLTFIAKTCKKYSKKPLLSLFLYYSFFYFVWTFSGIRQGVTIAVGVYYLLKCLEEKSTKKLIAISLLLSIVHASALVLIVLYFANRLDLNRNKLIVFSLISVLMSMLPLGGLLAPISSLSLFVRIVPYLSYDYSIFNAFNFQSIARMVFLFVGLLYYNSYVKQNHVSKIMMNTFILGLNLYFIFKFSELIAARLSIYGFYLSIITLPNIYAMYKNKFDKLIFMTLLLFLSTLYFYKELAAMEKNSGLVHSSEIFIPYTNTLKEREDYWFNNRYYID